ncbi:hypothetical protein [Marinobacter sp. OP 3.4]|uniref:hypothetical protein n=1 Tax=Marinobacter sp. OP 3.4 TaxID=3076501 RepID=UPI002E1D72F5
MIHLTLTVVVLVLCIAETARSYCDREFGWFVAMGFVSVFVAISTIGQVEAL